MNDEDGNVKYKISALKMELKELETRKKIDDMWDKEFSGQLNIRIKKALHKILTYEAIIMGWSLNRLIEKRLIESVWQDKELTGRMDGWDNE